MNKTVVLIVIAVVVVAAYATMGTLVGIGSVPSDIAWPAIAGLTTLVLGALLALLDPNPVVVTVEPPAEPTPVVPPVPPAA